MSWSTTIAIFLPSLPPDVFGRAFKALNREIGVQVMDTTPFLSACKRDNIEVLGWDLARLITCGTTWRTGRGRFLFPGIGVG